MRALTRGLRWCQPPNFEPMPGREGKQGGGEQAQQTNRFNGMGWFHGSSRLRQVGNAGDSLGRNAWASRGRQAPGGGSLSCSGALYERRAFRGRRSGATATFSDAPVLRYSLEYAEDRYSRCAPSAGRRRRTQDGIPSAGDRAAMPRRIRAAASSGAPTSDVVSPHCAFRPRRCRGHHNSGSASKRCWVSNRRG